MNLKGKTVVITGGTGSFGHQMTDELLKTSVGQVVLITNCEEEIVDMQRTHTDQRITFINADLRDRDRMFEVIHGDIVYHAGALKVIPFYEAYPMESVKTNIFGTTNIHDACIFNGVKKAIFISTDKAVNPINVYGMCKAMGEKLWLAPHHGETIFSAVRYGNVLNSRGSVIPFWLQCITEGKSLPITDTRMSRFHLTLKQAIDFVFNATKSLQDGRIYVPILPASNIMTIVEALAGPDYPHRIIGVRPGEKLAEVLVSEVEMRQTYIDLDRGYFIIHPFGVMRRDDVNEFTSENATQLTVNELKELLRSGGII